MACKSLFTRGKKKLKKIDACAIKTRPAGGCGREDNRSVQILDPWEVHTPLTILNFHFN